jgi:hypothetical protein
MKRLEFKLFASILLFSVVLYGIHKFLFFQFLAQSLQSKFIYSLELLYGYFFMASVIIVSVLVFIRKKNLDNVGFTFLFLTVTKMGIAFFFMQAILNSEGIHQPTEKMSFFAIFILFLTIETVMAVRILNNKQ